MKKENKYRGKIKDNGDWVCGYYVHYCETTLDNKIVWTDYIYVPNENGFSIRYEVEPLSIERYTVFHDKRGNEIYFGNIIRQKLEDSICENGWYWWYAEVKEVNGCAVLLQLDFDYSESKFPDEFTFLYEEAENVEVISDINEKAL